MSRLDIDAKLGRICAGVLTDEQTARVREAWWQVEQAADIGEPIGSLVWSPKT
jgi:hypothetical protein